MKEGTKIIIFYILLILVLLGFSLYLFIKFFYIKYELKTYKENLIEQEAYYTVLVREEGIDVAFNELKSNYDNDPTITSLCHDIAHFVGRAAAEKYSRVDEAFQHGDSFCWSGYYHGVMEGLLGDKKIKNLSQEIKSICSNITGKENYSFDYYNCVHGLGHGIMFVMDNELFDSLEICDNLNGWWERNSCYGGVFMENVNTNFKYHDTKYLDSEDLHYPCNAVNERYKGACYFMQTSYMLVITEANFPKMFSLCKEVDDPYKELCYQSIGRDASGYTITEPKKTKKICLKGKDIEQKENCVIGAANNFIAYYHSTKEAEILCDSLGNGLKKICFKIVGSSNI